MYATLNYLMWFNSEYFICMPYLTNVSAWVCACLWYTVPSKPGSKVRAGTWNLPYAEPAQLTLQMLWVPLSDSCVSGYPSCSLSLRSSCSQPQWAPWEALWLSIQCQYYVETRDGSRMQTRPSLLGYNILPSWLRWAEHCHVPQEPLGPWCPKGHFCRSPSRVIPGQILFLLSSDFLFTVSSGGKGRVFCFLFFDFPVLPIYLWLS